MHQIITKTPSVYTICLRRENGITIWLNLANVKRVVYDAPCKTLALYYLDNACERFNGKDAVNLASQINQVHAKNQIIQEDL